MNLHAQCNCYANAKNVLNRIKNPKIHIISLKEKGKRESRTTA